MSVTIDEVVITVEPEAPGQRDSPQAPPERPTRSAEVRRLLAALARHQRLERRLQAT